MTESSRIRNVAVVGVHHAGKTTLVEAILATTSAVTRRGNVADGSTVTDHEPECIGHAQSTCVGFAHFTDAEIDVTLVDAPGFIDFFEETKQVLLGVDAAIIVVEADPARVSLTRALMDFLQARQLAHCFVINKMERPGADFEGTLKALQDAYGRHVVAEQWPIGVGETFSGYVDLARMMAIDAASAAQTEVPTGLRERAQRAHGELLEAMADFDDHLMEELLEGTEPPLEEVERDICDECSHHQIIPVLVASGLHGYGVAALIAAIERWFPAPSVEPGTSVLARVIKTLIHPQSGKLSVVRILRGTLTGDASLYNVSRSAEKVRCAGLYRLQGKKQEPISEASAGQIVAIARLESVATGDTLASDAKATELPKLDIPPAVFSVAVRPKERIDEAKISQMLARIIDEDPGLRIERSEITHEMLLLGNGEQHVGIAVERLARKYKVEVETSAPMIPYLESVTLGTEIHSRYKHQTGGHGQFADIWIRFEPLPRGSGVQFDDKIVGGVVPRNFIPAVEKGVREALLHGSLGGHPVTDIHATLFDGQYHDVDSSEQSFRTAASMAVREALPKCKPVVLEPIVRIAVLVPAAFTAAVIGQLTAKRGQILGMNPTSEQGFDIIEADVPQVELPRYITELRTATQGLGTFTWQPLRYDPVPAGRSAPRAAV